ncbi:MAG: hypothetical protein KUG83_08175, partial [Gammaproteobacteria bacterium]|nr:hypothetical protein [Gammaproteobacteria bacterium]
IGFDEAALWELARGANGSMRDALSLTDQAIAYGNGTLRTDEVRTMLGTVDRSAVLVLLQRLAEGNAEALLQAVSQLSEQCPDYNDILAELITLLHRLTIAQAVPGYKDDNEEASTEADVLARLAGELTAEDVQLFYQVALMGRKDMPYVPDARRGLEMVLLRMLLFRPHSMGGGSSSVNPGSSEQATAKGLQSARENLGLKATTGAGETVKKKLICPPSAKNGNQNTPVEGLPVAGRQSIEATAQSRAADQIRPQALASAEDQISAESTQWDQLLPHLALSGAALNLARNCSKNEPAESEDTYHFIIDKQHTILLQPAREAMIKQALVDYIGRPVRFKIEVGESATNTPQQLQDKQQRQQQASAEQSIIENPGIKALIDQFDARIEAGSIKPRLLH